MPAGHFVVLCGYDRVEKTVLVADPYQPNPLAPGQQYVVSIDRVICAILLGILTYDANLLIIQPRVKRKGSRVSILIVANDPKEWPFQIPNVEVDRARRVSDAARIQRDAGRQAVQPVPFVPLSERAATTCRCWPKPRTQADAEHHHDPGHEDRRRWCGSSPTISTS